jgi:16S rRNA (cytosine967-C5)-methyltransferase
VLRARHELDERLAPLVRATWRTVPDELRQILRIGAYQLTRLSRVPPYAAVQATVELAKTRRGPRAAGMVNAVLRRIAVGAAADRRAGGPADREAKGSAHQSSAGSPEGRVGWRERDSMSAETPRGMQRPEGSPARLVQRIPLQGHPSWAVDRWLDRFGAERTEALLAHNDHPLPAFLHPARWSREELLEAFRRAGVEVTDAGAGLAVRRGRITELPGYSEGAFYVQDPTQAYLLDAAELPKGARVWDACAAPGGKAARLALDGYRVVASDLRRARLERLRDTVTRLGLGASLLLADARRPPLRPRSVDAALVDAPCTATGAIARHPDARWRLSPERLTAATRLQSVILDGVAAVVAQGGVLVYLTCSLEPEENETQVNGFLDRHPEFRRSRADAFVFPPDAGADGGFAARLTRIT